MKKLLRLTEGDLHKIVKESVSRIIKEIGGVYPDGQWICSLTKMGSMNIVPQ